MTIIRSAQALTDGTAVPAVPARAGTLLAHIMSSRMTIFSATPASAVVALTVTEQ